METKSKSVTFRLSEKELKFVKGQAKIHRVKVGTYIRGVLIGKIRKSLRNLS